MLKLGKQILHTLVLLITGMALIGVNVTQSGCIHSDRTYLEVRVLPAENTCPCEEECGCCQGERQFCKDGCHASTGSFPGFRPRWNRCVLSFVKTFCRSVLTMDLDKVCCHF